MTRLYFDEILEKWMVEEYDGNIREATPEELDATTDRWERETESGEQEAREGDDHNR